MERKGKKKFDRVKGLESRAWRGGHKDIEEKWENKVGESDGEVEA